MITDNTRKYARVIEASQRVRWEIEKDVICGRSFDYGRTFLPAGLSLVDVEEMMGRGMPAGYRQVAHPNEVGRAVLGKSTWAVLAGSRSTSSCLPRRISAPASSTARTSARCGRTCSCSTGAKSRSMPCSTSWS